MSVLLWLGVIFVIWGLFFWGLVNSTNMLPPLVFYSLIPLGFVALLAPYQALHDEDADSVTQAIARKVGRRKKWPY